MKSSSIHKVLNANGIAGAKVYRDSLIHDWKLPSEIQNQLFLYKLVWCPGPEIFQNLEDGELKIQGRSYSITWINSPGAIHRAINVEVSLRFCSMLERGYALIRVIQDPFTIERLEWS